MSETCLRRPGRLLCTEVKVLCRVRLQHCLVLLLIVIAAAAAAAAAPSIHHPHCPLSAQISKRYKTITAPRLTNHCLNVKDMTDSCRKGDQLHTVPFVKAKNY